MGNGEQELDIVALLSDEILDVIDKLYLTDRITSVARYFHFRKLAFQLQLKDLLPANWQELLKEEIKERRQTALLKIRNIKPLPFPDLTTRWTNMDKLAIVQRYKGKTIDDDYLQIAAGENDEYFGFASISDGIIDTDYREIENDSSLTDIRDLMKTDKDAFVLSFGKGALTTESRQPFSTCQNDNGDPLIVCFITGELQGFGQPESSHSIAFAAHQSYLAPKILDIFQDYEEDLDKTFAKLDKAFTRNEILARCFPGEHNGEILIMFANGKIVNMYKGESHKKYEWGETSMAFGYEPPKAVVENKGGLGKKKHTLPLNKIPTAMADAIKDAEDKKNDLGHMILPPSHRFQDFNDLKQWYNHYGDPAQMPDETTLNTMLKSPKKGIAVRIKKQITQQGFDKLLENKTIVLAEVQTSSTKVTKTEPTIPFTIISKESRELFDKEIAPKLQHYSDDSTLIIDPTKLADFMKDKPKFTEQIGRQMGLREFDNCSEDAFELMIKVYQKSGDIAPLKALFSEYRLENYMLRKEIDRLTATTVTRKAG